MQVRLLILLCLARHSILTSAQPSILTPPVDATVCLNSTAEFYCSTDGETLVWRLNGTGVNVFKELTSDSTYLHPGVESIFLVPGIHKFENTNITCIGGTFGVGSSTSDPVQLFVQGPPSPPSELTATPLNEPSIKLTWSVPPDVLDEELISYLVEVRNESGRLTVTDGTEYTFTMDNPDPCDLYSFTVTSLCDTVEGGSAEVNGTPFNVPEQVTVMNFSMELVDSEEALVTLKVPYSDGVCSYSVTAASIDGGEPLFTDKQFPPLSDEGNTVSISLQLPTSEEYYITVSACNALGCGPPSSPVFITSTLHTTEVFSSDASLTGLHTTPKPTSNTAHHETHTRAILIGALGSGMMLIIVASLTASFVYVIHKARSCNEHEDTGAYETVEIASPVPVGCPMNENQAYGIPQKAMLEDRKLALELHNAEFSDANFSMDLNEAYETVTEKLYETVN